MTTPPSPLRISPWRLWGPLLISLVLPACASGAGEPSPRAEARVPSVQQQLQRIEALIGDAPCDSDAQCRTIAVGHKACGGPGRYLAWSTRNVSQKELEALVHQHAQAERAESERLGLVSDCALVVDPGALCRAQRCQLQSGSSGGLPAR